MRTLFRLPKPIEPTVNCNKPATKVDIKALAQDVG